MAFTLGRPVTLRGRGFRTGRPVTIRLEPGTSGRGIVLNGRWQAAIGQARAVGHAVRVGGVAMVEHLLAACQGFRVTDLAVTVEGTEMPILDGSSRPYVAAFRRAGLRRTRGRAMFRLDRPVLVEARLGFIAAVPAGHLHLSCLTAVPEFGEQYVSLALTRTGFVREIAAARTVAITAEDPEQLQERLRLRFRLCRQGRFVGACRQRMPEEFCRHKLLDLAGDLALLGRRLGAEVFALNPGHRLNLEFVRALTGGMR
jgi:UDP-3-O-[3-hydroxymyristoyl] N-acetylglucosamine deacetylase